jgi:hypothetical protein
LDEELMRYWETYCKDNSNSNITLCYWKYFCEAIQENLTEEFIAEWEQRQEYLDYLSDWQTYVDFE